MLQSQIILQYFCRLLLWKIFIGYHLNPLLPSLFHLLITDYHISSLLNKKKIVNLAFFIFLVTKEFEIANFLPGAFIH